MHQLKITRTNGNVAKAMPGEDHVSGLYFCIPKSEVPEAWKKEPIQRVRSMAMAESLGITADATSWYVRMLHYQLSEVFRINEGIELYVMLGTGDVTDILLLQQYAEGRIRQVGVWTGAELTDVTAWHKIGKQCDEVLNAPLSIIVAPTVSSLTALKPYKTEMDTAYRVSVCICQDGAGVAQSLHEDSARPSGACVSAIGTVLGLVSLAAVHQSISWVKEFPTGVSCPAFADGTLRRNVSADLLDALDEGRYIFYVTYAGRSGSYINDSHTMEPMVSDYAMIENVRTMDKAVRGIRAALIPELGSSVYVDSEKGTLQPYCVTHLETTAQRTLEEMEKAGELSGYKVAIDPQQDVLSTGTIEVVIKQVAVGVLRKISVKIGFSKTV